MRHYSESALLTDLYEITMLQTYFSRGMDDTAVFEFFVRQLPPGRNFLLAVGLAQVVDYLTELLFDHDDLAWLSASGRFDPEFIASLIDFRFSGDVDALPEGTIFFADEPLIRITAPLREAQFIESRVMNLLHYQTLVASKALRGLATAPPYPVAVSETLQQLAQQVGAFSAWFGCQQSRAAGIKNLH